jgi:serine/threonine protein kinase/Flp pilus assembly protein TadD
MSVDFQRLREVFLEAVEQHAPEGWPRFLDQACGGDQALRDQLELLLRAHLEGRDAGADASRAAAPAGAAEPPFNLAGKVIGPYKLVEKIGDGGMGTVYMAEQTQPIQRMVALKIIKPGMDSQQVIARFEAERQALALMDHPNIARVLDAGTTDSGQPYFVMELIKGVAITRYCDDQRLTLEERLELCIPVCQAIQHAHQKGIIHRDVKPSNVLIALYDGKPVPKVIDFGVAKAIRTPLTDKTLFTGFGAIIGTLEYMSPEQAELNQLDVDTRSDIYGLGVLIYELLTGTTPIQRERIQRSANLEILRLIREEEPPTPSTRLETTGELQAIAARRSLEPRRLSGLVRGELDWIVMKCLEKDRGRRYDTADGLARDLRHFLADEPVDACPPSTYYRLRKLASKYRRLLTTAAAFLVLVLAGAAVAAWLAVRASKAEALAKEQADVAEQIAAFLQNDLLGASSPTTPSDKDLTLRTVLDRASAHVEERFKDRPLVEAGLDKVMGIAFLSLGDYASAEKHLVRALANDERVSGPVHRDTVGARMDLAVLRFRQGRLDEARRLHEQNLEIQRATIGPEDPDTLKTINNLGNVLMAQGRYQDARQLLEATLPVARRVLGSDERPLFNPTMILARAYSGLGMYDEARKLNEELVAAMRRTLGPEHMTTMIAENNLATVLKQQGHLDDARKLYEETVDVKRRTLGPEHPSTLVGLFNIADLDLTAGQLPEARALYEQILPVQRRVLGADHTDTLRTMQGLAVTLNQQGHRAEARALYEETLTSQRRALGAEHPDTLRTMNRLADLDLDDGRFDEARKLYDQVLAGFRRALGPKHRTTLELTKNLAWLRVTFADPRFWDPAQAAALANEALAQNPDDGDAWNTLGIVRYREGRWKEAIASLDKSMDLRKGGTSRDYYFLAMANWRLGKRDDAVDWYRKATDWMDKNQPKSAELKRFRAEADALMKSVKG